MRIQSSLEFIMILVGVSIFSLFVISQYIPLANIQSGSFSKLSNKLLNSNTSNSNSLNTYNTIQPNVTLFLPNTSYINKSNNLNILFSYPGSYRINSIKLVSENAIIYPNNISNISGSFIKLVGLNFIPKVAGLLHINAAIILTVGNSIFKYNYSGVSFSKYPSPYNNTSNNSNNSNNTVALISNRNESILFYPSNATQISNVQEWQHCTYINGLFGTPLPEYRQCGYNTYGFSLADWSSGGCVVHSKYVCFKFSGSNVYLQNISNRDTYLYKINLYTNINNINASTMLSNNFSSNQLISNNIKIGSAEINNVFTFNPNYSGYVIENKSNNKYIVNSTYYNNYLNATSRLGLILAEANGTNEPSNFYNYVNNVVGKINYYYSEIINEQPVEINKCTLSNDQLICKLNYPFVYNITVNIFNQSINKTVNYEDSIIHII